MTIQTLSNQYIIRITILFTCCILFLAGCKNERNSQTSGDGTRGQAIAVPLGQVVTDDLNPKYGDHTDWKIFAIPAPGVLAIRVYWDNSDQIRDAIITVHDKYGIQMAERIHDSLVPIDEILIRVEQGYFFLKIEAEKGNSIYSIKAEHLLVSPSGEDSEEEIPMMGSEIELPSLKGEGTGEGEIPTAVAEEGVGEVEDGGSIDSAEFVNVEGNFTSLVVPDIIEESESMDEFALDPTPTPNPSPAADPISTPTADPTPDPVFAGAMEMEDPAFTNPMDVDNTAFVDAGEPSFKDPEPSVKSQANQTEEIVAKLLTRESRGAGQTWLRLKIDSDIEIAVGYNGSIRDAKGKTLGKLEVMDVGRSGLFWAKINKESTDPIFDQIGSVVLDIPK